MKEWQKYTVHDIGQETTFLLGLKRYPINTDYHHYCGRMAKLGIEAGSYA